MKTKCLILVLFFVATLNLISKEDKCHSAKNLIVSNFWTLLPTDNVTFYDIQYHRKLTCNNTLGGEFKLPANTNISGYSLGVEFRHYFFADAMDGFYVSPGLAQIKLQEKGVKEKVEVYAFNFLAGYSVIFGEHFTFDGGIGLTYNTGPYLQKQTLQAGYSNTLPNIRIAFGWAF